MKASSLALLLPAIPSLAHPGDATGVIKEVHFGPAYGSKVFIRVEGIVTNQPACQTNSYHFVFDLTGVVGKELLATALVAKTSEQKVKINGYNTCEIFSNVEDLRWISID